MSSRSGKPSENESVENNPMGIFPKHGVAGISHSGDNQSFLFVGGVSGVFKPVRVSWTSADEAMSKGENV